MTGMPLTWNLAQLKTWGEKSGIPFWGTPQAKNTRPYDGRGECKRCNTCSVCPTQARYAPDFTFKQLLERKAITLHDRTLVRKLVLADGGGRSPRIESATGLHRDRPNDVVTYRAKTFVVASGYCWSSHLLLLSASSRVPERRRQLVGAGRQVHGRTRLHPVAHRARRRDLPGHERAAQPDLAAVLPRAEERAVRAPRPAAVGERGEPRRAAARRRRHGAARRRGDGRLEGAHETGDGAGARLLRRASRPRRAS